MRKILFIDHQFHVRTRSSDFFLTLLKRHFLVDVIYILPEEDRETEFGSLSDIDCVVLWQIDYMAPYFLDRGLPVVVIPMYDGSGSHSDLHWIASSRARFINFSRYLHEKIRILGGETLLLKYFLPPCPRNERATFDGLRVFFWRRRPEDGIDFDVVLRLFGSQLKKLHIHDHPDQPNGDLRPLPVELPNIDVTITKWFETRREYLDCLRRSNVFVAPRVSEGIGLGILEAMSFGMLVVANDQPTHNEYIRNWVNGVLFNKDNVGEAVFDEAPLLGQIAWETAAEGYDKWVRMEHAIVDFIRGAQRPPASASSRSKIRKELVSSFRAGKELYDRFLINLIRENPDFSRTPATRGSTDKPRTGELAKDNSYSSSAAGSPVGIAAIEFRSARFDFLVQLANGLTFEISQAELAEAMARTESSEVGSGAPPPPSDHRAVEQNGGDGMNEEPSNPDMGDEPDAASDIVAIVAKDKIASLRRQRRR